MNNSKQMNEENQQISEIKYQIFSFAFGEWFITNEINNQQCLLRINKKLNEIWILFGSDLAQRTYNDARKALYEMKYKHPEYVLVEKKNFGEFLLGMPRKITRGSGMTEEILDTIVTEADATKESKKMIKNQQDKLIFHTLGWIGSLSLFITICMIFYKLSIQNGSFSNNIELIRWIRTIYILGFLNLLISIAFFIRFLNLNTWSKVIQNIVIIGLSLFAIFYVWNNFISLIDPAILSESYSSIEIITLSPESISKMLWFSVGDCGIALIISIIRDVLSK